MIISNEPGYYEKNNFGIRIENLIYVKNNKGKTYFENLTLAPIDKELIDMSILNLKEKKWKNTVVSENKSEVLIVPKETLIKKIFTSKEFTALTLDLLKMAQ